MKKPIKPKNSRRPKTDKWEYFDDCEICQAMEKAEKENRQLSIQELSKAFEHQNNK